MHTEEKSIKEMFKELLVSHKEMTLAKAKKISQQVSDLERQSQEHKRYVEEQRAIAEQKVINDSCILMLKQLLTEAHNSVSDDIRISSLLNGKSMKIDFDNRTLYGRTHIFVGMKLNRFKLQKYEEAFQEALNTISTTALNDIATFIQELGAKYQFACFDKILGKGTDAELNPLIYWYDYSAFYSTHKYKLLSVQVVRMTPTETGLDIIFKINPSSIYRLNWWAIDTYRFPYILDQLSRGKDIMTLYDGK